MFGIMKRIFGFWLIMIGQLFSACSKDQLTDLHIGEGQYEYLRLSIKGGADTSEDELELARATYNVDGNANIKFSYFTDVNGAKIKSAKVLTVVFNGTEEIFSQELDWKVTNDGKRLEYDGELKIEKSKLSNATDLKVIAFFQNNSTYHYDVINSAKQNPVVLTPPYVMQTAVKQVGKALTLADPTTAKFKPWGTMVKLVVTNNMDVPTMIDGFRFYDAPGKTRTETLDEILYAPITLNKNGEITIESSVTSRYAETGEAHTSAEHPALELPQNEFTHIKPSQSATFYTWLPLEYTSKLPKIESSGFGETTGVLRKRPTQNGQIVTYDFTLRPGNYQDLPFGLYISHENIVQPYVNPDDSNMVVAGLYTDSFNDVARIERDMKQFIPTAHPGRKSVEFAHYQMAFTGMNSEQQIGVFLNKVWYTHKKVDPVSSNTYSIRFESKSGVIGDDGIDRAYLIINGVNHTLKTFFRSTVIFEKSRPQSRTQYVQQKIILQFLPYIEADKEQVLEDKYWEDNHSKVKTAILNDIYQINNFSYEDTVNKHVAPMYLSIEGAALHAANVPSLLMTNSRNIQLWQRFHTKFLVFTRDTY